MHNRIFAGAARILVVVGIASLILLPALNASAANGRRGASGGLTPGVGPRGAALEPDSFERVTLYARANYQWLYATGPVYGEAEETTADGPTIVRTQVGSFDLRRGTPAFPEELRTTVKLDRQEAQYFVLVARPGTDGMQAFQDLREAIVAQGGAIVRELGGSVFIVRLNRAAHTVTESHPAILAIDPYHPAYKLSPTIGRAPLQSPEKALSDEYSLDLMLFPGEDPAAAAKAATALGAKVTGVSADVIRVDANRDRLAALAGLEPVFEIHENLPIFMHGIETTAVMQVGQWQGNTAASTPYHLAKVNGGGLPGTCSVTTTTACQGDRDCPGVEICNGAGAPQVMMEVDSGIQLDTGDLSDTRTVAGIAGVAHRKVRVYQTTNQFNGSGDLLGCDQPTSSGFTHGHVVAATALGNATDVAARYGGGWQKADTTGLVWPIDGVAPRAVLVAYDANVTPLQGSCGDPTDSGLVVGDIYTGAGTGSLEVAYTTHAARTVNFSWGQTNNPEYGTNANRVDTFLANTTYDRAMVFLSAGNAGRDDDSDGTPDPSSVSEPATAKNAVVVGGSGNTNIPFNGANEQDRFFNSSVGPAGASGRIAPILMAPGTDFGAPRGNMGFDGEFACRSNDNNQLNPVECDVSQNASGTSFASPAAAGAAMLVRDYFAQGFYGDGTSGNPGNAGEIVTAVSGALVKAILIASADWMDNSQPGTPTNLPGDNLDAKYRFNNEQGYGRIQLNNVLPLQSYPDSPIGLIVADGGTAGGRLDISGLTGSLNLNDAANIDTGTFTVCDDSKELRVALVWMDPPGSTLVRDLDLEVCPPSNPTCTVPAGATPSPKIYFGNYFSDDDNRDGDLQLGEGCDLNHYTGSLVLVDDSPWTLPACSTSDRDRRNPTEAVMLSPDTRLDGRGCSNNANATCVIDADCGAWNICRDKDKETETGLWRVRVKTGVVTAATQKYAVVVTGGVCTGSSVQLSQTTFDCNDQVSVVVNEKDEPLDPAAGPPGLTPTEIGSRTLLEVYSASGVRVDVEDATSGLTFTNVGLKFTSNPIYLTDGTVPLAYNGVLDVRSGQTIRVTYKDEESDLPVLNKQRTNSASVDCQANVNVGLVVFNQIGFDTPQLVDGGCERDLRGYFTFGFPDRYMDEGERVVYRVAFQSQEEGLLQDVQVSLRCVLADADSPKDCTPGRFDMCVDPNRTNNASCGSRITVLDSPKNIGDLVPIGGVATASPQFTILVGAIPEAALPVDMLLGVSARKSGRAVETLLAYRTTLNADEQSFYYSTDFPTGGSENRDYVNDERIQAATTVPGGAFGTGELRDVDYRLEAIPWSSMQVSGRNLIITPWNFDSSNNGFTVGLNNTSTPWIPDIIANWGEDKNFNGVLDYACSLSPATVCPSVFPNGTCGRCSNDAGIICVQFCVGLGTCTVANVCSGDLTTPCNFGYVPTSVCGGGATTCVPAAGTLGICESAEDRDPRNGFLDNNWGTGGGCGWQTNFTHTPGVAGGVWHTGRVDVTGFVGDQCLVSGSQPGACQRYEVPAGITNIKREWEMLVTPLLQKVNICPGSPNCGASSDTASEKVFTVEFLDWAWNMAIDLEDEWAQLLWEFDTDTLSSSPIDLFNDESVLGVLSGPHGVMSGGNSPLTDGFQVFAPFFGTSSQNGSLGNNRVGRNPCYFEVAAGGNGPYNLADPKDDDKDNGYCDSNSPQPNAPCYIGQLPNPCSPGGACIGVNGQFDEYVKANGPIRNFQMSQASGPDMRFTTFEDIYGPSGENFLGALGFRVFEGNQDTGPAQPGYGVTVDDMVVQWREYKLGADGTTCSSTGGFCASIELQTGVTYEGNGSLTVTVIDSYPYRCTFLCTAGSAGIGASCYKNADCGVGGVCNTAAPSCTPENKNDCNHDGDYKDAALHCWNPVTNTGSDAACTTLGAPCAISGEFCFSADDNNCDDNGTPDVLARVFSQVEFLGEWVVCDRVTGQTDVYRGTLPTSLGTDVPGVLFVSRSVSTIVDDVTARYVDEWDGRSGGTKCQGSANPALWGLVEVGTNIQLRDAEIRVVSSRIAEQNGDQDGFPDTNETVNLFITVQNKTFGGTREATNVVAQIYTTDPKIDCVINGLLSIGTLAPNEIREIPTPFVFKVKSTSDRAGAVPAATCDSGVCSNGAGSCTVPANCARTVGQDYSAKFVVTFSATDVDVNTTTQNLFLDLDLNATSTAAATETFTEGFEGGFGNFQFQNLDSGIANNTLSNGRRCQYNDPDYPPSNSFGDSECYLGFKAGQSPINAWHIHSSTAPDGGRAYLGVQSAHWGTHTPGNPNLDTYQLSQMDALRTKSAINLAARICQNDPSANKRACTTAADCLVVGGGPCVSASPVLSFKHQISTTDARGTNTPDDQAADRGVVHALVSGATIWQKLYPFENVYDVQGTDQFTNCTFDPIDDGNNEDSYFDPTDPNRRFGPSSTCFGEFTFSYLGDTDTSFELGNVGRATDPPGLQGSLGIGTWVQSKFDLSRFRGRGVNLRFLITTIKVSETTTREEAHEWNPVPYDDGWYVDDIRVSQTLGTTASVVTTDSADNSALPGCGAVCSTLTPAITVAPALLPAPGQPTVLSAQTSSADRCLTGTLLFQFWVDGNNDGVGGDAADTLVQDFSPNSSYPDAPTVTTSYAVRVKCSSATSGTCAGAWSAATVTVDQPNLGLTKNLKFSNKTTIASPTEPALLIQYPLDLLRGPFSGPFGPTFNFAGTSCLFNNVPSATPLTDATVPTLGNGLYYLLRFNNGTWSALVPQEKNGVSVPTFRDASIPATCTP